VGDENRFIAQKPDDVRPILEYDKNGDIIEVIDEDALLTGPLSTTTFEDLTQLANKIIKLEVDFPKGNITASSYDDRFVNDISSKSIFQEDGSVVRFIIFSNKRLLIEVSWPSHKSATPQSPRLSPGNQIPSQAVSM
jgi:hypothetical protein